MNKDTKDKIKEQKEVLNIHETSNEKNFYKGMNNQLHSHSIKRLIMTDTDGNYILR